MLPSLPFQLSVETAQGWLVNRGRIAPDEPILDIEPLSGGVSGVVLKITTLEQCIVLKQPLLQLKVRDAWEIGLERVLFERDFMQLMTELGLGAGVPRLIDCDENSYILAMECADEDAREWKPALMRGTALPAVGFNAARLLAELQNRTFRQTAILQRFDHAWVFGQGRIAPYFLAAAAENPDLAAPLAELLKQYYVTPSVVVHGDFSPKNILYDPKGEVLLLDHELAHAGHPAFDPAFCLSHLVLKMICFPEHRAATHAAAQGFATTYLGAARLNWPDLEAQIIFQIGWLLLARVDGKSRVEYADEPQRTVIRKLARETILHAPATITELLHRAESRLARAA